MSESTGSRDYNFDSYLRRRASRLIAVNSYSSKAVGFTRSSVWEFEAASRLSCTVALLRIDLEWSGYSSEAKESVGCQKEERAVRHYLPAGYGFWPPS